MDKPYILITAALAVATIILIAVSGIATSNNMVQDPIGDDNGYGSIKYPTNQVFQPGVFDIVNYTVVVDEQYIYFKTYFRDLGGNPWNGSNGFSLQYIQIYVLTTDRSLPWSTYTYGLNTIIWHGWNYVLLINGGWGTEPLPSGESPAIYRADGSLLITEDHRLFNIYVEDNAVVASVDKTLLRDVDNYMKWVYIIAVTGYDGLSYNKVRLIVSGSPSEWEFGGGDQGAIDAGVQPYIIDMVTPTKDDQYNMLKSYNVSTGSKALIGGIDLYGNFYPPGRIYGNITYTTINTTITKTKTYTETKTVANTTFTYTYVSKTTEMETYTKTLTTTSPIILNHTLTTTVEKTVVSRETYTSTFTTTTTELSVNTFTKTVEKYTVSLYIGIVIMLLGITSMIYLLAKK